MNTLSENCIKIICENIECLADFFESSKLPWTLTKQIAKKFAEYKWRFLNKTAQNDQSRFCRNLDFVHCSRYILYKDRNAVLARSDWGYIFEDESEYCIWVNYYRIDTYNIYVCKECFDSIKGCHKRLRKHLIVINDHHHDLCESEDIIHDLYHNKDWWCQSCYRTVLFETNDKDSCIAKLHNSPRTLRFRGTYDSDSDIDHFDGF